jgi:hypothetical protein
MMVRRFESLGNGLGPSELVAGATAVCLLIVGIGLPPGGTLLPPDITIFPVKA